MLALVLGALAAGLAQPASAAEPGVNVTALNAAQAAQVKALGTPWVRMFLTWPDLEPGRNVWAANWFAYYEQEFQNLPRGTKVILDVVDSPRWETGSSAAHTPPAHAADYAQFIATIARRFGNRVAAYEIWNEEDEPRWWSGGPNPAAYAQLLQAAYPAVKGAEPNAKVVLGGLTGNDYEYLQQVYEAGGKGFFDAVGVHTDTACNILSPYDYIRGNNNRMYANSFLAYREVRKTMLANGDDKPIWMTELSWRTTSATCSEGVWAGQKRAGVTEAEQATFLLQAYHCLAEDPIVQVALWFPLQDEGGVTAGLERSNGSHKPSFGAMRDYVEKGDQLHESCGLFTGPRIVVASPSNGRRYSGRLPIRVRAVSPAGVKRIALWVDGRLIRDFWGHNPHSLSGKLNWLGAMRISIGAHRLTFVSYDKLHNSSRTSVTIFHAKPKKPKKSRRHGHSHKHH